jgi:hypothetical protein
MHINVPFGNIKRLSFSWKICLNMILWNISIVCFNIELHQFTSTPYIPQICKVVRSLYHRPDRIVAASRPLQIYTECESHRSRVVLVGFFRVFLWLVFFWQHNVFRYGFWLKW